MNFLTSPELTTAMTFSGSMEFNPMTDSLITPTGELFKFQPPSGESLPERGFDSGIHHIDSSNCKATKV
jgi:homoaconitase